MTDVTTPQAFLEGFVYEHLDTSRPSGSGYKACCPVPDHDDRRPSLSVGVGDNGAVVLHCFGGCEVEQVLDALGLAFRDLFPTPRSGPWRPRPDPEAAKWERVAERAVEQQRREAQAWYWEYRAAIFRWAGLELEARSCLLRAQSLGGGR